MYDLPSEDPEEPGLPDEFHYYQPHVVVELLSPGTEDEDLGKTLWDVEGPPNKWVVYEQVLKVPYYLVYSRYSNELRAFGLVLGRYREPSQLNGDP